MEIRAVRRILVLLALVVPLCARADEPRTLPRMFVSDVKDGVRASWQVAQIPFRGSASDYAIAGAIDAVVVLTGTLDLPARTSARKIHEDWSQTVDDIGHAYQGVPVEAATAGALYAYGLAAHNSAVRRVSAEIVEAYLIAGGGTQVLKYAIGRARPFNNQGPSHFVGPTVHNRNHSFPSGDCGSAFAFSTVLTAESRSLPVGVILYSLAATTAFQRLNRDQHWLSDVIGGAVWGTAVGLAVVNMNRKLVVSGKSVTVQPSRQGIGVQLSF